MGISVGNIVCLRDGCYLKVTSQYPGVIVGDIVYLGSLESESLSYGEQRRVHVSEVVSNLTHSVLD